MEKLWSAVGLYLVQCRCSVSGILVDQGPQEGNSIVFLEEVAFRKALSILGSPYQEGF